MDAATNDRDGDLAKVIEAEFERDFIEFQPWAKKTPAILDEQAIIKEMLTRRAGGKFAPGCFVARGAKILTREFVLGRNSIIAAGAIIRGAVQIGDNASVNPYAHIAGRIKIGSGVRIGGLVSIYGFNHGHARTDVPIYAQPHTSEGITIGDGTWIGANAVILDGCEIGAHCIIAGGAVVTKSFPDYQVLVGNPARAIKDRRESVVDP